MENITIGQIVGAIGIISVIGGFVTTIIKNIMKWYKSRITDRFVQIDNKFEEVQQRLDYVETKRDEYEGEVENSKFERKILMGGLLAALKGLKEMGCNDAVTSSIKEIEEYMMEKTH